jgi:uncharacterized protein YdeI (YjbR/CyaY-like superfamily)
MVERPTVEPGSRAAWRAWLEANHGAAPGVWVVHPKRRFAGPGDLDYEAIVLEALCFGWIDSVARRVDEQRTSLYVAPRKRRSGWAATNKARVERLIAEGLMAPAGLRAVEQAKADGSWTVLDASEAMAEPPDLRAALDADAVARARWDASPPSARKMAIGWIDMARRPETRAARIEEAVRAAAENRRVGPGAPRGG